MTETDVWQVSTEAAEVYEASFVPAIFAAWAPRIAAAANVGSGDHVLDVACGTGIAARHAWTRVCTPPSPMSAASSTSRLGELTAIRLVPRRPRPGGGSSFPAARARHAS